MSMMVEVKSPFDGAHVGHLLEKLAVEVTQTLVNQ